MIPENAMKAVEGGVEVTIINVISPINIDDIPENIDPLEYLEVKIDGEIQPRDQLQRLVVTLGGRKYTWSNVLDARGETVPVGGELKIFFPTDKVKAGEEHEVDVTIKTDNPINIKVTRTVQ